MCYYNNNNNNNVYNNMELFYFVLVSSCNMFLPQPLKVSQRRRSDLGRPDARERPGGRRATEGSPPGKEVQMMVNILGRRAARLWNQNHDHDFFGQYWNHDYSNDYFLSLKR